MNEEDIENLKWLKIFRLSAALISIDNWVNIINTSFSTYYLTNNITLYSKYDLYSKSKVLVDIEKVKPYYMSLIEKVNG